jgi:molybdopterin converting factor small subunit
MRITVEFLSLPNIAKLVGGKSVLVDFPGGSIQQLIGEVAGKYGEKVSDFLLGPDGRLDNDFRVVLNKKEWLNHQQLDRQLQEGDIVTITMLVGGG